MPSVDCFGILTMKNIQDTPRYEYVEGDARSSKRTEFNNRNSALFFTETVPDVLFIGDSITEYWELAPFFSEYGVLINRGWAGEVVENLVERFYYDAVSLHPRVCVFSEGINNTWAMFERNRLNPLKQSETDDFIRHMESMYREIFEQAKKARMTLVAGSVLPVGTDDIRNDLVLLMNASIIKLCREYGVAYADYHAAVTGEDGKRLKDLTFGDLLHPHAGGYALMADVLKPILKKILGVKHG